MRTTWEPRITASKRIIWIIICSVFTTSCSSRRQLISPVHYPIRHVLMRVGGVRARHHGISACLNCAENPWLATTSCRWSIEVTKLQARIRDPAALHATGERRQIMILRTTSTFITSAITAKVNNGWFKRAPRKMTNTRTDRAVPLNIELAQFWSNLKTSVQRLGNLL